MSGAPEDLSPARVAELLRDGAQAVDVREQYERDAGHIADTLHIELDQLGARVEELDRERPLVFYCRTGSRSALAAQAFAAAGERLFVHFLSYLRGEADISVLACHHPRPVIQPFGIADVTVPDALAALSALPRPSIVIKIDERVGLDRARQLHALGHPVFVLVHDTRPKHVCEMIADLAKDQVVEIRVAHLMQDGSYSALLVHPRRDGFVMLSPITGLGLRLVNRTFEDDERVELWGDDMRLPIFASGAMTKRHLGDLLAATYLVGE